MKKLLSAKILLLATLWSLSPALFAHHSHAMFDHEQEIEISGQVVAFHFSNPHSMLYLEIQGQNDENIIWSVEMGPINNLLENGITRNTYAGGDLARIKINPLRNGEPGGSLVDTLSVIRNGEETTSQ